MGCFIRRGVNAFFIDEKEFDKKFIEELKDGYGFRENFSTRWSYRNTWQEQLKDMKYLPMKKI